MKKGRETKAQPRRGQQVSCPPCPWESVPSRSDRQRPKKVCSKEKFNYIRGGKKILRGTNNF